MTKLSSYLKERRIRQADFAEQVGVSQGVISRLANGASKPGLDLAVRIERATAGSVSASTWVSLQEETRSMEEVT